MAHVWQLRKDGSRLPGHVVEQRGPSYGQLAFKARVGDLMLAQLMEPDGGYVIRPLDRAKVWRIDPHGILIVGFEPYSRSASIKSKTEYTRQTWWCVPAVGA